MDDFELTANMVRSALEEHLEVPFLVEIEEREKPSTESEDFQHAMMDIGLWGLPSFRPPRSGRYYVKVWVNSAADAVPVTVPLNMMSDDEILEVMRQNPKPPFHYVLDFIGGLDTIRGSIESFIIPKIEAEFNKHYGTSFEND